MRRLGRCALALAILLVGCVKRFNPREAGSLSSSNTAADQSFQRARADFQAGRYEQARVAFNQFSKDYPDDPLAPFAKIFAGRASYEKKDYERAAHVLEVPAAGPPDRAATES